MTTLTERPAEVLAAPRLIASPEDLLLAQERMATARQRLHILNLLAEFLRAYKASCAASERVARMDTGGWGGEEAEADYLYDAAENAWHKVEAGWHVMAGSWASRLFVVDEAREAGEEYTGHQRRVAGHAVAQSSEPWDWSRSGRDAA